MTSDSAQVAQQRTRASGFYRLVWRWHFYAGICCIPIILTLSLSGAIYLFKPQIDSWVERPYYSVAVESARHTPNEIIRSALEALPGSKFASYRLPKTDREAVVVSVMDKGERILVYVDAYSLEPLKIVGYNDQFIRQVRSFHGELLAGDVGSILVELAGCWAIVLIITGLFLWWPRNTRGLAGVLYPRLSSKGRTLWRDMHSVLGMWLSMALLFLLISGLPWAMVWGSAFKEVRSALAGLNSQDWVVTSVEEGRRLTQSSVSEADLTPELLKGAEGLRFAAPAELTVLDTRTNTWRLSSNHQNRTLRAVASLDGNSGEVQSVSPFSERALIDRVIGIGISIHEGHLFGWVNQLLGLVVAMGAVGLAVTGCLMWWRRKPAGSLGAPNPLPNMRMGRAATGILLGLALFLPLLAVSLVVLLVLEWLVIRRIKPINRWLGLVNS